MHGYKQPIVTICYHDLPPIYHDLPWFTTISSSNSLTQATGHLLRRGLLWMVLLFALFLAPGAVPKLKRTSKNEDIMRHLLRTKTWGHHEFSHGCSMVFRKMFLDFSNITAAFAKLAGEAWWRSRWAPVHCQTPPDDWLRLRNSQRFRWRTDLKYGAPFVPVYHPQYYGYGSIFSDPM